METCIRAGSRLCRLLLPNIFASSPGLLKTRQTESAIVGSECPYLLLCNLLLQAFPTKIFASSTYSLMKTLRHLVHPSLVAAAPIAGSEVSRLPQDILMDIFALLEIPDLLRAGAVCSTWHAAYTSLLSHGCYHRPQTPCLLYTSESDADNVACLYNLAAGPYRQIRGPCAKQWTGP